MIREYDISPVAKPRMLRSDRWKARPEVLRYWDFCSQVKLNKVQLPVSGAKVTFILPVRKSWTKKKYREMLGKPHQQVPDLDNLVKALCDAIYGNDSCVWQITACKKWGIKGKIVIETEV